MPQSRMGSLFMVVLAYGMECGDISRGRVRESRKKGDCDSLKE